MPKEINANFQQEKNKSENQPIFLYEINFQLPENNPLNWLYFAEHDTDILYQGKTYLKFPLTHEYISENAQGQIDSVRVRIANVSREIQYYLESYNALRGRKVIIKTVWQNLLNDPDAYIEDVYYIDSVISNENNAEFSLTSKFDVLQVELPTRRFSRNHCAWIFKSQECGYTGLATECNKTLQRCRELQNQIRYGAFPSIPSRPVYV